MEWDRVKLLNWSSHTHGYIRIGSLQLDFCFEFPEPELFSQMSSMAGHITCNCKELVMKGTMFSQS
jgi:hypothetical protein